MQPGYKDSKKTKTKNKKQKRYLIPNSGSKSGSTVQPRFVFRHMSRAIRLSRPDRTMFNQSRGCLCFVLCAAAVDPPDCGYDTNVRSSMPGKDTAKPIPPNLRLGSHVDCLHRPMSFSGPYVHCASITLQLARNSETRLEGTHRPYTQ